MTIQKLQHVLAEIIKEGTNKPTDKVKFRHTVIERSKISSEVDYILTGDEDNSIVLCYDDGMF